MIQGGDPKGTGAGNATLINQDILQQDEYSIPGEFILNGFKKIHLNTVVKHYQWLEQIILKWVKAQLKSYNSASAHIMTADNTNQMVNIKAFVVIDWWS